MAESLPYLPLSSRLTALRGVGPAYAAALAEAGMETLRDLLWGLPHRYVDRGSVRRIAELDRWHQPGGDREIITVMGTLKDLRQTTTRIQRMNLLEALLEDGSGTLRLIWFNQGYLTRTLKPGDRILAFGPLAMGRHGLEMRGPAVEVLGRGSVADEPWIRRFLPLYRKLGPITGRVRGRLVQEALGKAHVVEDWLPVELSRGLPDLLGALRLLHQPPDDADAADLEARTTPAHQRLATEELFAFALGISLRRAGRLRRRGVVVPTSAELRERLRGLLPFHLTGAQRRAFKEIVDDLTSGRVMHRLLQGMWAAGRPWWPSWPWPWWRKRAGRRRCWCRPKCWPGSMR